MNVLLCLGLNPQPIALLFGCLFDVGRYDGYVVESVVGGAAVVGVGVGVGMVVEAAAVLGSTIRWLLLLLLLLLSIYLLGKKSGSDTVYSWCIVR